MSFLKNLFNANKPEKEPQKPFPWKLLTDVSQLDEVTEISKTKPVAIFKHSTRCGISNMVIKQFEREYEIAENSLDLYYLDLLNHRDISDEIAARFQVFHQSPQLLVIKNGRCIKHSSHHEILGMEIT